MEAAGDQVASPSSAAVQDSTCSTPGPGGAPGAGEQAARETPKRAAMWGRIRHGWYSAPGRAASPIVPLVPSVERAAAKGRAPGVGRAAAKGGCGQSRTLAERTLSVRARVAAESLMGVS